jgi:hypothetical protein
VVTAPQKIASTYQRHRPLMATGSPSSHSWTATTGQAKPPAPSPAGAASVPASRGAAATGLSGGVLLAAAAAPRVAGNAVRKATERGIQTGEPPSPSLPPNRS